MSEADETRDGVALTNLDQPLSDREDATKRDLVDYLDAVGDRILPHLRGRPLSVIRVRPGQPPFMQKNLPRYTPDWVRRAPVWAEASHRKSRTPSATTAVPCSGSPTNARWSTTRRWPPSRTCTARPT